jgi:hypothetical protein
MRGGGRERSEARHLWIGMQFWLGLTCGGVKQPLK